MEDQLFNTEEKRQAAIVTFQTGIDTPFWQLMTQILEANIKVLTERIVAGGDDTTEKEMNRLRDKLAIHKEIINTPQAMIEKLTSAEGKEPNLDPFQTVEELKEEREKVSG